MSRVAIGWGRSSAKISMKRPSWEESDLVWVCERSVCLCCCCLYNVPSFSFAVFVTLLLLLLLTLFIDFPQKKMLSARSSLSVKDENILVSQTNKMALDKENTVRRKSIFLWFTPFFGYLPAEICGGHFVRAQPRLSVVPCFNQTDP